MITVTTINPDGTPGTRIAAVNTVLQAESVSALYQRYDPEYGHRIEEHGLLGTVLIRDIAPVSSQTPGAVTVGAIRY